MTLDEAIALATNQDIKYNLNLATYDDMYQATHDVAEVATHKAVEQQTNSSETYMILSWATCLAIVKSTESPQK